MPVVKSVNINANESEKLHWYCPYSSEANIKLKLIGVEIGLKSNSNIEALFEFITVPVPANTISSSSVSPVQSGGKPPKPSLKGVMVLFGPGTLAAFPVDKTIPSSKGNSELLLLKYPIPLTEPKFVPVEVVILVTLAQVVFKNTSSINCCVVYWVVLAVIGGKILPIHKSKVISWIVAAADQTLIK